MKLEILKSKVHNTWVEKHLHNANRNLHGGAICTLVDVVGTLGRIDKTLAWIT